jgi:prophage regulatory protein|tara:strand:+ start:425 stop:628 length:204 start_codon:yes stop_codon:yes gene_type:complete
VDLTKSFIRITKVIELTSLSKSTIYRLIKKDRFPKPITLRGMENVRLFVKDEVEDWIKEQIATCRVA